MRKWLCIVLICLLCTPAFAETVQDQALLFIQEAGIEADSVMRLENSIIVTLADGGTASLWTSGDFDPFDLSWRFAGATDADVARYLDHALGMLAALEERIPAAGESQARNYAVVVSNSLLCMEQMDEQGLRILLEQLSRHDETNLNSLRARLASRLLGSLDNTPVDPREGLAWYDSLTLSVQDDLPLPDASAYVEDAFLAEVTSLLIAHEEERRAAYSWGRDVEAAKTTTFVFLSNVTTQMEGDRAVVFCHMASEKIALYDGARARIISGGWYPVRVELARTAEGWTLTRLIEPEDGTRYWPSILAFCDDNALLAKQLISANTPMLHLAHDLALQHYFASIGYPNVTVD